MSDGPIIIALLAAFASGFLIGRLFPIRTMPVIDARVRRGGIELIRFDDIWPRPARLRFVGLLALLVALVTASLLLAIR